MLLERIEPPVFYGRFGRLDGVRESGFFRIRRCEYAWATLEIIDRTAGTVRFTDERDAHVATLRVGERYVWIYDYFDAPLVEAIADAAHEWRPLTFEPSNAIQTTPDGVKTIIPGGWDHEHCQLYGERIDVEQPVAYAYAEGYFLCKACHDRYVPAHDLSFLIESSDLV